jgi:uncharacterized membrane protein
MRVDASLRVHAPPDVVWPLVSDPHRACELMAGVTRWDVDGDRDRGLGARYRVLMQVGSVPVGGLVEIVEWDEGCDIAWTSVTGVDQRGRWRVRRCDDGTTDVTLRIAYGAPGGILGLLADRFSAPMVRANLRRTLERLRAEAESSRKPG